MKMITQAKANGPVNFTDINAETSTDPQLPCA